MSRRAALMVALSILGVPTLAHAQAAPGGPAGAPTRPPPTRGGDEGGSVTGRILDGLGDAVRARRERERREAEQRERDEAANREAQLQAERQAEADRAADQARQDAEAAARAAREAELAAQARARDAERAAALAAQRAAAERAVAERAAAEREARLAAERRRVAEQAAARPRPQRPAPPPSARPRPAPAQATERATPDSIEPPVVSAVVPRPEALLPAAVLLPEPEPPPIWPWILAAVAGVAAAGGAFAWFRRTPNATATAAAAPPSILPELRPIADPGQVEAPQVIAEETGPALTFLVHRAPTGDIAYEEAAP